MLMNAELKHRINYELTLLEHAKKVYSQRLELLRDCKGAFLRRSKHGTSGYFFHIKRRGYGKYEYLGRSGHPDVKRVQEARFLEQVLRRIDRNIELMEALLDGFLPYDPSHVCESLPKVYRCEVPPVSELYQRKGAEWKAGQLEFQKRFPENYPQFKTQRTSDGVMVKTISEVVLYEMVKDAGLAYVYELPFVPEDHGPALYPDLSVLSPIDMESVIFIEYVGRLDDPGYCEKFAKRVSRYIKSGYIPGVNLFFAFSDEKGNIDSTQIAMIIADIFGLRSLQAA
ncbi:MAG: hypothetical protein IJJ06_03505 [Mogibacterium sp.]|nr:hypothetical protein [Mogibacterium sp.]